MSKVSQDEKDPGGSHRIREDSSPTAPGFEMLQAELSAARQLLPKAHRALFDASTPQAQREAREARKVLLDAAIQAAQHLAMNASTEQSALEAYHELLDLYTVSGDWGEFAHLLLDTLGFYKPGDNLSTQIGALKLSTAELLRVAAEEFILSGIDTAPLMALSYHEVTRERLQAAKATLHQIFLKIFQEEKARASPNVPAGAPSHPISTAPPRLAVNIATCTVTLDGETFPVNSSQAVRWVKVLIDHPGEWIAARTLKDFDPDLDGARTDRLRRFLPPPVLALFDSETGKGSRLRLA